jgi:uncharacterized protein
MNDPKLRIRVVSSLAEIPAGEWDACAAGVSESVSEKAFQAEILAHRVNPKPKFEAQVSSQSSTREKIHNPFISHAFLYALEQSNSIGGDTGWQSYHLLAEAADGLLMGAMPCYVKMHSRGEYVFDHGWAEAFARMGGEYYPKLQVAVPFTPVTGPRLLARSGHFTRSIRKAFADELIEITNENGLSSVHVTFPTESEWHLLASRGYMQRTDQQFRWENAGYTQFDNFLEALASRKRKAIRRERKDALSRDIEVAWLKGADITEDVWDAFFAFYMDTGSRKWGSPYLTREFFSRIGEVMSDRILLIMAKRAGRWIAGAINFIGENTLYGRHWGSMEHHPFLHFELCYYQAIEYAIQHKLMHVEAGAQGEHKLARGYLPYKTYSAHFIANPILRQAINEFLRRERAFVETIGQEFVAAAPFRKF